MKNTDLLFFNAEKFQNDRRKTLEAYDQRMKSLQSAKGSEYYETESKKAAEEKDTKLNSLKREFLKSSDVVLKSMLEKSNARSFTAPTQEEIRMLEALKMRSNVSEEEIEKLANSITSPLAVETLKDIAKENGYIKHIDSTSDCEMSIKTVNELIKSLSASLADFADYDTSRAARLAVEAKERRYGLTGTENIPKRALFDTKEGFFSEVAPYISNERIAAFSEAVDGD
jgi:hypothetical protein